MVVGRGGDVTDSQCFYGLTYDRFTATRHFENGIFKIMIKPGSFEEWFLHLMFARRKKGVRLRILVMGNLISMRLLLSFCHYFLTVL